MFLQSLGFIFMLLILFYLMAGLIRYRQLLKIGEAKKTWKDAFRAILLWPMTFWVA